MFFFLIHYYILENSRAFKCNYTVHTKSPPPLLFLNFFFLSHHHPLLSSSFYIFYRRLFFLIIFILYNYNPRSRLLISIKWWKIKHPPSSSVPFLFSMLWRVLCELRGVHLRKYEGTEKRRRSEEEKKKEVFVWFV